MLTTYDSTYEPLGPSGALFKRRCIKIKNGHPGHDPGRRRTTFFNLIAYCMNFPKSTPNKRRSLDLHPVSITRPWSNKRGPIIASKERKKKDGKGHFIPIFFYFFTAPFYKFSFRIKIIRSTWLLTVWRSSYISLWESIIDFFVFGNSFSKFSEPIVLLLLLNLVVNVHGENVNV